MKTTLVISLIGDDRAGLVESISQCVMDLKGQWLASQLCRLEGKFAGTLQVSVPVGNSQALQQGLKALSIQGLQVMVTEAVKAEPFPGYGMTLSFVGPDRRGVIAEISEKLRELGVSINGLTSHCQPAAMSSEMIFHAVFDVRVPVSLSSDRIANALDEMAPELMLDLDSVEANVC